MVLSVVWLGYNGKVLYPVVDIITSHTLNMNGTAGAQNTLPIHEWKLHTQTFPVKSNAFGFTFLWSGWIEKRKRKRKGLTPHITWGKLIYWKVWIIMIISDVYGLSWVNPFCYGTNIKVSSTVKSTYDQSKPCSTRPNQPCKITLIHIPSLPLSC